MVNLLFVCTGNICRSPTAEGVFIHRARAAGLEASADSAGVAGYHIGDPPDPRTVACARRRGVDLSTLRARKVAPADFGRFDLILAMDRGHLRRLQQFDGARGTELALFGTAAGLGEIDVPDP
ncbi:MAG: low molecular weight protein-tyrosine-phosphatase, partial [Pseudomonadota bacterium]